MQYSFIIQFLNGLLNRTYDINYRRIRLFFGKIDVVQISEQTLRVFLVRAFVIYERQD